MTKFKHILTILLISLMAIAIVFAAVACDKNTEETESEKTEETTESETLLIENGRFSKYDTSKTTAPYSPTSWTATSQGTTTNTVSGVVPMDETQFNNMNSEWDGLQYDAVKKATEEKNDYALMIYNKVGEGEDNKGNAFSYSPSTSFNTTIGSYYKFSVDFLVVKGSEDIAQGSGVFITFSNKAYHRFGPFTPDGWQTVTFYVAGSELETSGITISLALGISDHYTSGYAFFDNVLAEKITAEEYAKHSNELTDKSASYSMLVPDGNFVNVSGTDIKVDSIWSGASGKGEGSNSSSEYVKYGVITTDEQGWEAWKSYDSSQTGDSVGTPYSVDNTLSKDKNVLAISNEYALGSATTLENAFTAYGYTNSLGINIAPGMVTKLSVWVNAHINSYDTVKNTLQGRGINPGENDVMTATHGAYIVLSGIECEPFEVLGTNNQWVCYSFYILGDSEVYKTVNLELWLGKGGKGDATRANGTVYFDNITLELVEAFGDRAQTKTRYEQDYVSTANGAAKVVSFDSTYPQLIENSNFEQGLTNWTVERLNDIRESDTDVKEQVLDTTQTLENNPKAPYAFNPVLMVQHINPSATYIRNIETVEVRQNLYYMVSIWLKTEDIDTSNGITIALYDADGDSSLTSFTGVNTASYENDMPSVNGYAHYTFYIKGSHSNDENSVTNSHYVYVRIAFGSGNNFSTASFVKGTVYIANISMQQVSAAEYTDATTGTYIKKQDFSSSSSSATGMTNGNFNDITDDAEKIDDETGNQSALQKASSWTTSSLTGVNAGILNVNQPYAATVKTAIGMPADADIYNNWSAGVTADSSKYNVDFAAPNLFVAYTTAAVKPAKLLYNTSSKTLSKNSYYIITAFVRAYGTKGELELVTSGYEGTTIVPFGSTDKNDSAWEEVVFVVKTGIFAEVNATLNLYLGAFSTDSDTDCQAGSAIFMDAVSCRSVDVDEYDAVLANAGKNNGQGIDGKTYITYTFDSGKYIPDSTSGGLFNGSGSTDHKKVVGIYSKANTITELKYYEKTTDEEGTTTSTAVDDKTITVDDVFADDALAGATLGDCVLVINNQEAGYYAFTSQGSLTLESKKAYAISVWARTLNVAEGVSAYVRIVADAKYDVAVNSEHLYKLDDKGNFEYDENGNHKYVDADSKWHEYVIYIYNNKSSSQTANLKLILGQSPSDAGTEESHPERGTAFFDNITMQEIDYADFKAQYEKIYDIDETTGKAKVDENEKEILLDGNGAYLQYNNAVRLEDDYTPDADDDNNTDDNKGDEKEKTDSSLIWLYITSIVIAAMLIIVIVVWLINRNKKAIKGFFDKIFKKEQKVEYSRKEEVEGKKARKEEQDNDEDNID